MSLENTSFRINLSNRISQVGTERNASLLDQVETFRSAFEAEKLNEPYLNKIVDLVSVVIN
jgi:hypothetical protein